jgi:hypothetical protein
MNITPTDKGSLIAGVGVSSLAWLSMFKLDTMAKLCHVNRWVSQDKIFGWISRNKSLSILCTEVLNFGTHGITNPAGVLFALGSTIINSVFIFIVVPIRVKTRMEKVMFR